MRSRWLWVLFAPSVVLAVVAGIRRDSVLGAAAAYSAMLALILKAPREVREVVHEAATRDQEFARERAELQTRIDVLSAQREISLVLNEDVDLKMILEKVLAIIEDAIGAEEIEVYTRGENGDLVPRAARVGGRTVFRAAGSRTVDPLMPACLEHGEAVMMAEEGRMHVLAPLSADRELIGVVRFTTAVDRGQMAAEHFRELSKFIALALKTPDLYTRATHDGLTGLASKRHLLTELAAEVAACRRRQEPLSLIMLDIDHFKKVNDKHGHQAGDRILIAIGALLKKKLRKGDGKAFRYGGEEMVVLLPRTPIEGAAEVAERLRMAIAEKKFSIGRRKTLQVTSSFGVAAFHLSMEDGAELIQKADEALYKAKKRGRNRVAVSKWEELAGVRVPR